MNNQTNTMTRERTRKMAMLAMMTAIVVILQCLGSFIHFGQFSISLVLAPIVVGAVLFGPLAGAWLGAVFSVMVFITGDAALFLTFSPAGTIVTVLAKGILAGLATGLVYKALNRLNKYAAVIAAAAVCPIVNTGVFFLGTLVFFYNKLPNIADTIKAPLSGNPVAYVITALIGLNFVFELIVNIVLAPVIIRLTELGKKSMHS